MRRSAHLLDWENRPHPFKEYVGIEPLPLPEGSDLARLLRWGAGVVRTRSHGPDTYHFRTYSSAGALYPVEVYVADPGGLYHFHPRELALRRLRDVDVRGALADSAVEDSAVEDSAVEDSARTILILTGIMWRTAWKYGERGYRHLYWDAGTMLANLLDYAGALGLQARVLTGFVDAEASRILGADGEREAALALVAVGRAGPSPLRTGELPPLTLEVAPLSRREARSPEAHALHTASSLATAEEVRRYRAGHEARSGNTDLGLSHEELERVLRRRGSVREFALDPVPVADLAAILTRAMDDIPADVPPSNELYLVANAVDGLAPGAYRFSPPGKFKLLREGVFRRHAGALALEQALGARAAATCFLLADLDRVLGALGNRGYRAAQLEAGIRVGRVYLGAYGRDLGATASTFYDDAVTQFFAPETAKSPMLCVAVGRRG